MQRFIVGTVLGLALCVGARGQTQDYTAATGAGRVFTDWGATPGATFTADQPIEFLVMVRHTLVNGVTWDSKEVVSSVYRRGLAVAGQTPTTVTFGGYVGPQGWATNPPPVVGQTSPSWMGTGTKTVLSVLLNSACNRVMATAPGRAGACLWGDFAR